MSGGCGLINKICVCLTCGSGRYVVRFVHTILCIAIPTTLIFDRHSDLYQWIVLHEGSYLYGFFYIGILLASLIFYYCACLTDPGYVDQRILADLIAEEEDNEELLFQRTDLNGHEHSLLHASDSPIEGGAANKSSANNNSSNSAAIMTADDMNEEGLIEMSSLGEVEETSPSAPLIQTTEAISDEPARICKVCNIPQPLRSRHCEDCKRCVLKFDHHCPWLSTCVGEKNHKFFWLFLLFINIVIILTMTMAVRAFPQHKPSSPELTSSDIAMVLFIILDCIILVVGGLSAISLFGFHTYLMITNQTTWESVSRNRISYLKKLRDENNPFHMGYCANIYTFCCKCSPKQWKTIYRKSTSTAHLFEPV